MSSHKYGLATDWIVGMTAVLANGTLTQCNATSNTDLFWGLRGGGSNLGIVVSYSFATFEVQNVTVFNIPVRGWNVTTAPKHLATLGKRQPFFFLVSPISRFPSLEWPILNGLWMLTLLQYVLCSPTVFISKSSKHQELKWRHCFMLPSLLMEISLMGF